MKRFVAVFFALLSLSFGVVNADAVRSKKATPLHVSVSIATARLRKATKHRAWGL